METLTPETLLHVAATLRNEGYYNASYKTLEVLKRLEPLPQFRILCSLEQVRDHKYYSAVQHLHIGSII